MQSTILEQTTIADLKSFVTDLHTTERKYVPFQVVRNSFHIDKYSLQRFEKITSKNLPKS